MGTRGGRGEQDGPAGETGSSPASDVLPLLDPKGCHAYLSDARNQTSWGRKRRPANTPTISPTISHSLFTLSGGDFHTYFHTSRGNGGLWHTLQKCLPLKRKLSRAPGNRDGASAARSVLLLVRGLQGPVFLNPAAGTWGLELDFIVNCLSSSSAGAGQRWMTRSHCPGHQQRDQEQRLALVHTS